MKLKRLEITGFKSFSDKTAIDFPIGVSAIVGPNGCGKSNIVDALRWVMGEQSVKQLRGKDKEDIIFSGTNGKPPQNMAEVSLTLLNDNGSAPEELKDYSEIQLTRRLYRSGETSYLLNKKPCRLKDIHNVFLGSGMGAKSYSVIQQGNVGAITEAGPDERRFFIEEAAGITRYKNRKIEALRKVEATKQNLFRVKDIILEITRQMASLKRQAKKAEMFKRLQEKIQFLDITLSGHRYDGFTQQIKETSDLLQGLHDEDQGHSTQLQQLDAAIESIKLKRQEKSQEISEQKSKIWETQRQIDKIESELGYLRKDVQNLSEELKSFETAYVDLNQKNADILSEISQVESDNSEIQQKVDAVKAQIEAERLASAEIRETLDTLNKTLESGKSDLMQLVAEEARYQNIFQNATQNKESLKRRLKRIDEEAYTAEKQVSHLNQTVTEAQHHLDTLIQESDEMKVEVENSRNRLGEKNKELSEKVKSIQTMELDKNKAESRYSTLKKMQDSYQWYKDGVKAVMQQYKKDTTDSPGNEAVIGLIADILEPEPDYETAVEAVLGESLQYILTKNQSAGREAIAFLQETKAGRSGFVPLEAIAPLDCDQWEKPDPNARLMNHISVKSGYENIAEALLGHVVVAEDMDSAVNMHNTHGAHQTIVSKDGNIISHQGIMIGGSQGNLSGILSKKHEIRELKEQIDVLENKIAAEQDDFHALESQMRTLENALQKRLEHQHNLEKDAIDAEKALYKVSEDLKHAKRHLEVVRLDQENLMGEEIDIDEQIAQYNRSLATIQNNVKDAQQAVTRITGEIDTVSANLESFNQKIQDLKLELTTHYAGIESNNSTLRRLRDFYADSVTRLETLEQDIKHKKERKRQSQEKLDTAGPTLAAMYEEIKRFESELQINESDYQSIDTELRNNDGIISELKTQREEVLQKIRMLELELSQINIRRDNTASRLAERYNRSLSQLKMAISEKTELKEKYEGMTIEELEHKLNAHKSKIEKITDVNLGAIKEYEELKLRYEFLEEQQNDLQKAIDNLHRVIKKINTITQERFLKTFEEINQKLDVVFPRLFDGGMAKLVMTDPADPLETGVEFMVHPPGKKLTRLSLLSGGEKALSAIAFIFSIFLIKPASFCLMDEIDAPLDDANVFRFNDLLKIIGEKSQIIMITHNKRSMEFADSLFGITMEKQGVSKVVSVNFENAALN